MHFGPDSLQACPLDYKRAYIDALGDFYCQLLSVCHFEHLQYQPVVHVFWSWERLHWPVQEAVQEDHSGTRGPHHQDSNERYAQVVDHL